MQIHIIDGNTVNSSFDYETTESMLRSFLAISTAAAQQGFDTMTEKQQEEVASAYYEKPVSSPDSDDVKKYHFDEPFMIEMDNGQTVVIHATAGQWFVLLESEMLSFMPGK